MNSRAEGFANLCSKEEQRSNLARGDGQGSSGSSGENNQPPPSGNNNNPPGGRVPCEQIASPSICEEREDCKPITSGGGIPGCTTGTFTGCQSKAECGNGKIEEEEECDDGEENHDFQSCTLECKNNICGDFRILSNPVISDPPDSDSDKQSPKYEECDDGNTVGGDGCSANCTEEHTCTINNEPQQLSEEEWNELRRQGKVGVNSCCVYGGCYDCDDFANNYCYENTGFESCEIAHIQLVLAGPPPISFGHAINLGRSRTGNSYRFCFVEPQAKQVIPSACWEQSSSLAIPTSVPTSVKRALCQFYHPEIVDQCTQNIRIFLYRPGQTPSSLPFGSGEPRWWESGSYDEVRRICRDICINNRDPRIRRCNDVFNDGKNAEGNIQYPQCREGETTACFIEENGIRVQVLALGCCYSQTIMNRIWCTNPPVSECSTLNGQYCTTRGQLRDCTQNGMPYYYCCTNSLIWKDVQQINRQTDGVNCQPPNCNNYFGRECNSATDPQYRLCRRSNGEFIYLSCKDGSWDESCVYQNESS
jgi:cysteine-rich repeat protein